MDMWTVTAWKADGTMVQLAYHTREQAHAAYDQLAADEDFVSYRCDSPVLLNEGSDV